MGTVINKTINLAETTDDDSHMYISSRCKVLS